MFSIRSYPRNKDKFLRLLDFFADILVVCQQVNLDPVLEGSLAAFLYTEDSAMVVNDIDLCHPEADYPLLARAAKKRGIDAEIKPWRALQMRRDDLKVEFADAAFWYPGVSLAVQGYLHLGEQKVKVPALDSLIAFYACGLQNLQDDEAKRQKYEDVKTKHGALKRARERRRRTSR